MRPVRAAIVPLAVSVLAVLLVFPGHVAGRQPAAGARRVGAAPPDVIDRAWERGLESPPPEDETPGLVYERHNTHPSRTLFEKYPYNPVLTIGPSHTFDSGHAEYPSVVAVADSLWVFYAAYGAGSHWSIAAATSRDGIRWHKLGVVLEPDTTQGAWDGATVAFPCVLHDDRAAPAERFQMYYAGKSGPSYAGIGLATSPDGERWTRRGRILSIGGESEWDGEQILDPAVVRTGDGGYRLYYCGARPRAPLFAVGVALSADGRQWVKYPDNPVYELTSRQGRGLYTVDALITADGGTVLFESSPDPQLCSDIYGVTSADGFSFDPENRRVVLSPAHDETWDDVMVYGMDVLARGGRLYMWFNGIYRRNVTAGGQVGLARADAGRLVEYLSYRLE